MGNPEELIKLEHKRHKQEKEGLGGGLETSQQERLERAAGQAVAEVLQQDTRTYLERSDMPVIFSSSDDIDAAFYRHHKQKRLLEQAIQSDRFDDRTSKYLKLMELEAKCGFASDVAQHLKSLGKCATRERHDTASERDILRKGILFVLVALGNQINATEKTETQFRETMPNLCEDARKNLHEDTMQALFGPDGIAPNAIRNFIIRISNGTVDASFDRNIDTDGPGDHMIILNLSRLYAETAQMTDPKNLESLSSIDELLKTLLHSDGHDRFMVLELQAAAQELIAERRQALVKHEHIAANPIEYSVYNDPNLAQSRRNIPWERAEEMRRPGREAVEKQNQYHKEQVPIVREQIKRLEIFLQNLQRFADEKISPATQDHTRILEKRYLQPKKLVA